MKHKVIDNFLDEEYFDSLVTLFIDKGKNNKGDGSQFTMPWFFDSSSSDNDEDIFFYMWHLFYEAHEPKSPHFNALLPLLEILGARCVIQAKANFYPNTHILHEHQMHVDYTWPCSGAILSLNTCDGYTKVKDGTKIDSVANRLLLHDPITEHCGTSTTNAAARFNININYIPVQFHLMDGMMINERWL